MVDYKRALIRDGKKTFKLQDFNEIAKKQYTGKYGPYRGRKQDILTTIEFGFSPFVPMSQQYIMQESQAGDGVSIGPKDIGKNQEWMSNLSSWASTRGKFSWDDEKTMKLPRDRIKSEAERVSARLAEIISQDIGTPEVTKKYATEHRAEIEDQAFVTYLLEKNPGYLFDANPDLPRFDRKTGLGFSDQAIDLANKDEKSRMTTLATINAIMQSERQEGDLFLAKSFETTSMTRDKWYQGVSYGIMQHEKDSQKAWRMTVELMLEVIKKKWDTIGQDLTHLYTVTEPGRETWSGWGISSTVPKGRVKFTDEFSTQELKALGITGDMASTITSVLTEFAARGTSGAKMDSIQYTFHQMISRFIDIQAHDELGGVFSIVAPISKFEQGVATFKPHFSTVNTYVGGYGSNTLTDITLEFSAVMGGAKFEAFVGRNKDALVTIGTNRYFSSHTQLLAMWAVDNQLLKDWEVKQALEWSAQEVKNQEALAWGRDGMIGVALESLQTVGIGNWLDSRATVSAVEILAAKTAGDNLRKGIINMFGDPGVESELKTFYRSAMQGSRIVSDYWKTGLQIGTEFNSKATNFQPFGTEGQAPPYINEENLKGVGIPMFFTVGREETAFNIFAAKQRDSVAKGKKAQYNEWEWDTTKKGKRKFKGIGPKIKVREPTYVHGGRGGPTTRAPRKGNFSRWGVR